MTLILFCCLYSFMHCDNVNSSHISNPHQLQLYAKSKLCNRDIDPDEYFYKQICATFSLYYHEDELKHMLLHKSITNNFSLVHLNARSLNKNLDHLSVYLDTLKYSFDIIIVTETLANSDNMTFLSIPGYNTVFKNRPNGRRGVVAIFVRDSVYFTERTDLNLYDNDSMESLFIEVTDINSGKNIIGAIYRSPENDISLFSNALESRMSIVTRGNYECIIAGDYNIDLLKSEQHIELNIFLTIYLLILLYRLSPSPLATVLIAQN